MSGKKQKNEKKSELFPFSEENLEQIAKRLGVGLPEINSLGRTVALDNREFAESVVVSESEPDSGEWTLSIQTPIGSAGTKISPTGQINTEHNLRLRPMFARGSANNTGVYEQMAREDPIIANALNHVGAIGTNATYEPVGIDKLDKRAAKIATKAHERLMCIESGFRRFIRDAMTAPKFGFSLFELIWDTTKKDVYIDDIQFREQSTVQEWVLDERQHKLVGTIHQLPVTAGTQDFRYFLPHDASSPETARSLLINIGATGNNFEGVSLIRPAVPFQKLKKIIIAAFGISYTRYGCPIPILTEGSVANPNRPDGVEHGIKASDDDKEDTLDEMQNRDSDDDVIVERAGLSIRYETPVGDMPDPIPMLEYLDTQMGICVSNEGALLGQQSAVGSYALAEVSDNRFLRSAPVYTSAIADALTEILHMTLRFNLGEEKFRKLQFRPYYTSRFSGSQDASEWIDDALKVAKAMKESGKNMPDVIRQSIATRLGLPENALDNELLDSTISDLNPDSSEAPVVDEGGEKVQDVTLNGAQIAALLELIALVSTRQLPREAALQIISTAFNISNQEADLLMGPVGDTFFVEVDDADPVQPEVAMSNARATIREFSGEFSFANDDPPNVRAARRRIQTLIDNGTLKPPSERKCVSCEEKATQYDHTEGYAKENWESVEPVCNSCHKRRTDRRGSKGKRNKTKAR